ncbi:MAG: glutamate--cysteine ligase [Cyanobacteriota bacterium]|nr:glutamate--cysteine ligase [Cyanobacteriota bacterium]
MSATLLSKGFEVEMYTGRADGTVLGCAAEAATALAGFVTEPDNRNLEYTTPPDPSYQRQLELLLEPRRRLRHWLQPRGLTLLPGSTLSTGDSLRFERSDPANPYHEYIANTYGTRVVTASVHINLGISAMDALFAGLRLLRCEAALLLALSASSPFLDNQVCGAHSQRWIQFPLTPIHVPLFTDHPHFITWMESELAAGSMLNVRHLWTSVRPNGDARPHDLNRLEIRICDLVSDPRQLLAITAFAELRLQQLLANPGQHDPLQASPLNARELAQLADSNDQAAALSSLDALLTHWCDGRQLTARDWIAEDLRSMAPLASQLGLESVLAPLQTILLPVADGGGNPAMRWLDELQAGHTIAEIIARSAAELNDQELALSARLATDASTALLR